jgi:hypothetical protein
MRRTELVARIYEMMNACKILVKISENKSLVGRSSRRWKDTIKRDVGIRSNGVDSSDTEYKTAAVSYEYTTVKLLVSINVREE